MAKLELFLSDRNYSVQLLPLVAPGSLQDQRAIFLTEIDEPMFTNLTCEEWNCLKQKILSASSILWVTRGSLASGKNPEFAMINGLVSALRAESKSLKFVTVDIDDDDTVPLIEHFEGLLALEKSANAHVPERDAEFRARGGITHIPRLTTDIELNEAAQKKKESSTQAKLLPCTEVMQTEFQLVLEKPAALGTVCLEETQHFVEELADDSCQIRIYFLRVGKMVCDLLKDKSLQLMLS